MIRWPWIMIARAPASHIALTTAWMSCWWTMNSWSRRSEDSRTSRGVSDIVTVMPGPVTGVKPAAPRIPRALARSFCTVLSFTAAESSSTSWVRLRARAWRRSTFWLSLRTREAIVVTRPGRRSVPWLLLALMKKRAPESAKTSGVPIAHRRRAARWSCERSVVRSWSGVVMRLR